MRDAQQRTEVKVDAGSPTIATGAPPPPRPPDTAADAADPRIGTLLKDCYRLERRLGSGGMGAVYLAEHVAIKKKVAIKILDVEATHRNELRERFLREARAAAMIADDHVIAIHDFGDTPDGSVFFAMEYLQGVDLSDVLAREAPLPWPRARDLCLQICRALQAAHDCGIVHRDMKPANVFRVDRPDREFIKVLDFGIAKSMSPDPLSGAALTRTGMLFGTPEYMSPEQAEGGRLDHRVDIYAVGVILFQMLTGKLPFQAETFMALLNRHLFEAPPRPTEVAPHAGIPPAAEAVVLKALQKDPGNRFQSMAEMSAALVAVDAGVAPVLVAEAIRQGPTSSALFRTQEASTGDSRRWWLLGGAIGGSVIATTITIIALATREAPPPPAPEPAPAVVAEPPHAPPVKAPEPPPEPHSSLVTVRLDTGGPVAHIYDDSNAYLGSTGDAEGLRLPRSETPHQVVLRAPGYYDLRIKIIPYDDRTISAPLVATRKPRPAPKPEAPPADTGETPPGETTTPPETPPDNKPTPAPDNKATPAPDNKSTPTSEPKTPAKPDGKPASKPPPPLDPGPAAKKPGP
jgi:serine/threonine-protein kinase